MQAALPLIGNAVLLLSPLALILLHPGSLPETVAQAGRPGSWVALLLASAVATVFAGRMVAGVHVLCGLGLAVGVLCAATAAKWDRENWLAYHTLAVSWLVLGVGVWRWSRRRGPGEPDEEAGSGLDDETEQRLDELLARFD